MADRQLDALHIPDFGLGPEYHKFAQGADEGFNEGFDEGFDEGFNLANQLDMGDGTPAGTSGFQSVSDISGSAIVTHNGTHGDSGTSDPSKLLGAVNSSMKRPRDNQGALNSHSKRVGPNTMTGRFCGRLPTKEDEKRLVKECMLIGQYLNKDPARMNTLATIIRGIASGKVRGHLVKGAEECRELRLMVERMRSQIEMIERQSDRDAQVVNLSGTIVHLRQELNSVRLELNTLREQNATQERQRADHAPSEPLSGMGADSHGSADPLIKKRLNTPSNLPVDVDVQVGTSLMGGINCVAQGVPPLDQFGPAPPDANSLGTESPIQFDLPSLTSCPSEQNIIPSIEETVQFVCKLAGAPLDADLTESIAVLVPGAQQFVRAAALHLVAKNEAASHAHSLTTEARKHSDASIKAAELAKDLRKTLSEMTRHEMSCQKAVDAQKTVETLELRAQMHASMTSHAVIKAKNMMGIVHNHNREVAIATATANAMQKKAHASSSGSQSLAGSPRMEPSSGGNPSHVDVAVGKLMSMMNNIMSGDAHAASTIPLSMANTPTSTVAKPDLASIVGMDDGNIGADGLPDMALNLQNAPPPPQAPLPFLDHAISYTHEIDPSIEARAFQEQIASMHAEQPDALVRAEPIHITETEFDALNLYIPDIPDMM